MNKDERHLNLLSIFHTIFGSLAYFASILVLLFLAFEIMFKDSPDNQESIVTPEAYKIAIASELSLFVAMVALGIVLIIAANKLKNHKSRTFCLAIAGIDCLIIPLGTFLGILTIIVLMRESVIQMFGGKSLPESPGQADPGISI